MNIKLEGFPSVTIHSTIKEIAESALKITPKRLSTKSGGELPTKTNPQTGAEEPMSTTYQARAPIDDPAGQYRLGLRARPAYTPSGFPWAPASGGWWPTRSTSSCRSRHAPCAVRRCCGTVSRPRHAVVARSPDRATAVAFKR